MIAASTYAAANFFSGEEMILGGNEVPWRWQVDPFDFESGKAIYLERNRYAHGTNATQVDFPWAAKMERHFLLLNKLVTEQFPTFQKM